MNTSVCLVILTIVEYELLKKKKKLYLDSVPMRTWDSNEWGINLYIRGKSNVKLQVSKETFISS